MEKTMVKNGVITVAACILMLSSNIYAEMTYFAHKGKLDTVAFIGKGKKAGSGTTDKIHSMGDKQFGNAWNIEFSGIMELSKAGKYEFVINSDDGSALYINNKQIVKNDGLHGNVMNKKAVNLPAGKQNSLSVTPRGIEPRFSG